MPRKFDQDAKDRVVRLVEDRILAENMSMQAACQEVAPKLGSRGTQLVNGLKPARRSGNIPESVPEDLVAENARVKSWVVVYLFSNLGLVSWRWFRGHLGDKG